MAICVYCGEAVEKWDYHDACIRAYGLDYDPQSEKDAKRFLREREQMMKELLEGVA